MFFLSSLRRPQDKIQWVCAHLAKSASFNSTTDSFSWGHDPFTLACKARPSFDGCGTSLSVSLSLSLSWWSAVLSVGTPALERRTLGTIGTPALEQEPWAPDKERRTPVLLGVRTMREDSPASSHGRSGFLGVPVARQSKTARAPTPKLEGVSPRIANPIQPATAIQP